VEFGPEDAVAAAERLIRPADGGVPIVADPTPTSSTAVEHTHEPDDRPPLDRPAPTPTHLRVLAVVLLLIFLAPFIATVVRTAMR